MKQSRQYLTTHLQTLYQGDELNAIVWWIMEELTRKNRAILLSNPNEIIFPEIENKLENIVKRLLNNEPIQYIFGHTAWCGMQLKVNSSVLIPRPETAELLDLVATAPRTILDIGTGSGCIAIAMKKRFPNAEVYAIDISKKALDTAKENAANNNATIHFIQADILQQPTIDLRFDLIVSNPPYIAEKEKIEMDKNVLDYEPHNALFVPDNDPLVFYREISLFAKKHINPNGQLLFEINQRYGNETQELVQAIMTTTRVDLLQDTYKNNRFISVKL
ncbi:MAG: peptide chain release factor N(5)-glutamine methyltransferase [Paludibacteraceae bacterium]|nr:peptide chain release factor N(5)-glutamine methyltransferase [Paludibacteraceae bacterium]